MEFISHGYQIHENEDHRMATKSTRMKITFECTECKNRNYDSFKNKRNDPDRLELKKYCPVCKKHTVHKESK